MQSWYCSPTYRPQLPFRNNFYSWKYLCTEISEAPLPFWRDVPTSLCSQKAQAFAKGHMQHRSCFNASGTRLIGGLDLLIICQFVTAGLQGVGEGESFCLVLSLNAELGCQNLHPTTRHCEKKSQTILFFLLFPAGYAASDVLPSHHDCRNVYCI